MGLAMQKESEIVQSNETAGKSLMGQRAGPAILWGILLSEMSTEAMTDGFSNLAASEVLDMNAIINLWITAGYDCQLPMEENAASWAVTDAIHVNNEESPQSYESPPDPTGPYIIQESPGKGQGVFATRDVVKGERILVDKPFFTVTKLCYPQKVLAEFETMSLTQRQQYMQLCCPDRTDDITLTDVIRIFEANCFNIGPRSAMFLMATRFNHSCLPNTYYSWSDERDEISFHAMVDIPEGEEMTICYGRPFLTLPERELELRIYNFYCTCAACQTGTTFGRASESRRLAMRDLNEQITTFQSQLNETPVAYRLRDPLTAILRLIEIIKEEGLHGELMTPYRDAADHLKGRGNFKEALKYARLELEEEVVCLGNDSEVVHQTIEYIEELERELEKAKENEDEPEEDKQKEDFETNINTNLDKTPTPPNADTQKPNRPLCQGTASKPNPNEKDPNKDPQKTHDHPPTPAPPTQTTTTIEPKTPPAKKTLKGHTLT